MLAFASQSLLRSPSNAARLAQATPQPVAEQARLAPYSTGAAAAGIL
jgi:hypothetical protein